MESQLSTLNNKGYPKKLSVFGFHPSRGNILIVIKKSYSDVYSKRQTSDSSWEFLKIENAQLKIVQNNCCIQN